jgi:hypothetical protein
MMDIDVLWERIVGELAELQDETRAESPGHVSNPVSGGIYLRDTAFAAAVFATQYACAGRREWRERAEAALSALAPHDVFGGVPEPVWNRFGWHARRGSLAATGMLLDALWHARGQLGIRPEEAELAKMALYLSRCRIGSGLFAHDEVPRGSAPPPVQNTTALALHLMVLGAEVEPGFFREERAATWRRLREGQRPDGFWPYVYPDVAQRIYAASPSIGRVVLRRLPLVRGRVLRTGDRSIAFGDALHHCLVLHYALRSLVPGEAEAWKLDAVRRGWGWVSDRLVPVAEAGLRFDFSDEPVPEVPRYCNFRDTSTYFLVLASLPLLIARAILSEEEARRISSGVAAHVARSLLKPPGVRPGIEAYEGPVEVTRNILPRVGESVAWKGFCLCEPLLRRAKRESPSHGVPAPIPASRTPR